MATPETTAKTEASSTSVVANDEPIAHTTSPTTGSNSDYLAATATSQPDPSNLTPSTRPEAERAVSGLSSVAQPSSTPGTDLSTPPPTSTPTTIATHPVTVEDEPELDPKVAGLLAMFPAFDPGVLQSILEVSGGDEDQAIETLLSMSDPEYKPSTTVHQQNDQTDLDEQLAHRLHLEEQARADYEARHGSSRPIPPSGRDSGQHTEGGPMGPSGVDMGALGAQVKGFLSGAAAKVSSSGFGRGGGGNVRQQGGPATGSSPSNVNTAEIGRQFNELAETGKKHLSTLMTKVKAKMQEYDIPAPGQSGGPHQGSNNTQPGSYSPYAQSGSTTVYGSQSNQRPQQQWYPQPVGTQPQPAISSPVAQQPQQRPAMGYNVDPPTPVVPPKDTLPSPGATASGSTPAATGALGISQPGIPQRSSFDQTDAPRPTFDTSRLGLKPKRPVSLVGNNNGTVLADSTAAKGKNRAEDDDDDIEYVNETSR